MLSEKHQNADKQYGKDIKWDEQSYTPHDVATIFRRYVVFNESSGQ